MISHVNVRFQTAYFLRLKLYRSKFNINKKAIPEFRNGFLLKSDTVFRRKLTRRD
jgi:hypothetical protein